LNQGVAGPRPYNSARSDYRNVNVVEEIMADKSPSILPSLWSGNPFADLRKEMDQVVENFFGKNKLLSASEGEGFLARRSTSSVDDQIVDRRTSRYRRKRHRHLDPERRAEPKGEKKMRRRTTKTITMSSNGAMAASSAR
jgi:hypothetical protein